MEKKLPGWIGIGGFTLALAAGAINACMLLSVVHEPVSHLTGTTTNFAIALSAWRVPDALRLGGMLVCFFAGSVVSGMIIRDYHVRLGRRYGVVLFMESVGILYALAVFKSGPLVSQMVLSAVCGLQNAMATTFSRSVVRTTHVTGLITDLGIQLGHALIKLAIDIQKMKLMAILVGGYFIGALVSALLFVHFGVQVLLLPAAITGCIGVPYYVYRSTHGTRRPEA